MEDYTPAILMIIFVLTILVQTNIIRDEQLDNKSKKIEQAQTVLVDMVGIVPKGMW